MLRFWLAFCFLIFSISAQSQNINSCDLLLEHGINNITKYLSGRHTLVYKWEKYCRIDHMQSSDKTITTVDGDIFGLGGGSDFLSIDQKRSRVLNFCDSNRAFAEANSVLFAEAQILSTPALAAWSQCIQMARKDIQITMTPSGDHAQFVHFEVDSTHDGDLVFYGIEQVGYSCKAKMVRDKEIINLNTQPKIRNSNIQIDCSRLPPKVSVENGSGKIKYDLSYISINTSGPHLSISFPKVVESFYVTPPGAIIAFNSEKCPSGWIDYSIGNGRFLIGTGELKSGKLVNIGDRGGKYEHQHDGVTGGATNPVRRVKPGDHASVFPHEHHFVTNMADHLPPYVGVKYCYRPFKS